MINKFNSMEYKQKFDSNCKMGKKCEKNFEIFNNDINQRTLNYINSNNNNNNNNNINKFSIFKPQFPIFPFNNAVLIQNSSNFSRNNDYINNGLQNLNEHQNYFYISNEIINSNYYQNMMTFCQNKQNLHYPKLYEYQNIYNNTIKDMKYYPFDKNINYNNFIQKKNPNKNSQLIAFEQLLNKLKASDTTLVAFIKSQTGSREMQRLLNKIYPTEITSILHSIKSNLNELMIDKYGNYFCQKLIQICSTEQRGEILRIIKNDFTKICCNSFGTHSLQTLVELLNLKEEQLMICKCIIENMLEIAIDQKGTHIVQRFFSCADKEIKSILLQKSIDIFKFLIINPNGVCVIIKFLKFSNDTKEKNDLINCITQNALNIIQNPYGNYVIQELLNNNIQKCQEILKVINNNFYSLSIQKFSSNVVENYIRINTNEVIKQNLLDVIKNGKIEQMLKNIYGNMLIVKILNKLNKETKREILDMIESNNNELTISNIINLLNE